MARFGWVTPSLFTSSGGNVELDDKVNTELVVGRGPCPDEAAWVITVGFGISMFWRWEDNIGTIGVVRNVRCSDWEVSFFIRLRIFIILCKSCIICQ